MLDDEHVEIRAHHAPHKRCVELYVSAEDRRTGQWSHCQGIVLVPALEGRSRKPTVEIPEDAAKQLMTDLWYAGFRPTDVQHATDAAQNMARHLADMRAIVFAKLEVTMPGE